MQGEDRTPVKGCLLIELVRARKVESMQDVEVQRWSGEGATRDFGWRSVGICEALRLEGPFRCPECQKPVRLHRSSEDGTNPAHAEHKTGSKTCSRSCYYE